MLAEAATASYRTAARLLLSTTSPFQDLIDRVGVTHNHCNQQAVQILKNDGWRQEGNWLANRLQIINAGSAWADKNWKNAAHYYNPLTKHGLFGWPTALEECSKYFQMATTNLDQQNYAQACFYLGAAAHLIQDLCVPHHSRNTILAGHQRYEKWVEKHVHDYLVESKGVYNESLKTVDEWLSINAQASYDLFSMVNHFSYRGFHRATKILLPQAQRISAGFFQFFLRH